MVDVVALAFTELEYRNSWGGENTDTDQDFGRVTIVNNKLYSDAPDHFSSSNCKTNLKGC